MHYLTSKSPKTSYLNHKCSDKRAKFPIDGLLGGGGGSDESTFPTNHHLIRSIWLGVRENRGEFFKTCWELIQGTQETL